MLLKAQVQLPAIFSIISPQRNNRDNNNNNNLGILSIDLIDCFDTHVIFVIEENKVVDH